MQTSSLHLWQTCDDQGWYNIFFLIKEKINNDVDKDDHNNIDDEKEEPKINMFKVSSLGKWGVDRGQESSKDKETGEGTHEAVGEVIYVDVEGEICKNRQEKRLEKCSWNSLHV